MKPIFKAVPRQSRGLHLRLSNAQLTRGDSVMQCCIVQPNTTYMSDIRIRWAIVFGYPILYEVYDSTMNTMEYERRVSTNVLGTNRHNLDERQNDKLFRVYIVISFDSLVICFEKLVLRKLVNLNHDFHSSRIFAFACSRCIT